MITMKNHSVKNHIKLLDEDGMGLVGALIAASMVVTIALVVAHFVTSQNQQSVKLELSGSCQNIANSIVEYIKKDETSLFISSYGPAPGTTSYASGLDKTDDGLDRFVFGGVSAPLFTGPSGFRMSISNNAQAVPNNWKYFNNLNIKNSTNRLLALAASGDFCCSDLDMNNPNCGTRFLDDSTTRPGLRISEKNVTIDLAVNFKSPAGASICTGRRLAIANIPGSTYSTPTEFKVKVTMDGIGNGKSCVAGGTIKQNADKAASLTLMEMQGQGAFCPAGKNGLPSHCNAATPVVFKVKTVKNSSGSSCLTQCLSQVESRACNSLGALNLFNTFSNTACVNNCLESEPGSSFLCKIGEKNWFTNNPNHWEPCETARVYDHNGANAGTVRIEYTPTYNDERSEVTTNATITLSSLTEGRAYVVDVRAVDTGGNIGPSFCSTNPNSCAAASDPHFVVIPPAPVVGSITETTLRIAPTTLAAQLGRDSTITSQAKYATALSPFGANQYQCESGAPRFSVPVTYAVPAGAYSGFVTDSCTATLRLPNGTVQNPACVCTGGNCVAQLPASAIDGAYDFDMNIVNYCGGAGATRSQDWCKDGNTAIGIANGGNQVFGTNPDFENQVTYPTAATKACGVVSLCPNVNGGFTPTIGACPNATIGWDPMQHSGCLQAPGNNYCMLAMDPCGRSQATTPVAYSTTLMGVTYTSATDTANSCFEYGAFKVGGNSCEAGSYCNASGKCNTTCATPPCPVNTTTPANSNCGPRYCPVLNSCTGTIGTPSSSVACTSVPPVNGLCGTANGTTVGSAPTLNLCSVGTTSAVTGTGPWSWACLGSSGGTDAPCSANRSGSGGCSAATKPNCVIFACGGNNLNCKKVPICNGTTWSCESIGL